MAFRYFLTLLLGLVGYAVFAQPADCDDRQIYAPLSVDYRDCDSIALTGYPLSGTDLQWYVDGVEIPGATATSFTYTGQIDGVTFGLRASNATYCSVAEQLVVLPGGCPREDCFNGVDDDGNGLVDLLDPGCACTDPPDREGGNLFPNPNFEQRRDDPECRGCYNAGEMFPCVAGWRPGSAPSTLEHVLRCYSERVNSPFLPYVDDTENGSIIGGFAGYDSIGFTTMETAQVVLPEPTVPGKPYVLRFQADLAGGDIDRITAGQGADFTKFLAWYWSPTAGEIPYRFPTAQPADGTGVFADWTILDSVLVTYDGDFSLDTYELFFTAPPEPIRSMVFAAATTQDRRQAIVDRFGDYVFYWVLDNVELRCLEPPEVEPAEVDATVSRRELPPAVPTGNDCDRDLLLSVPDVAGNAYQWYRNGVALVGATGPEYRVPAAELDGAFYRVFIRRANTCRLSDPVEAAAAAAADVTLTAEPSPCYDPSGGRLTVVANDGADLLDRYALRWLDSLGNVLPGTGQALSVGGLDYGGYTLELTPAGGCPLLLSTSLAPAAAPLLAAPTVDTVRCDSPDGQALIRLNVTGGQPPYVTVWNGDSLDYAPNYRRPAGTYSVTVLDAAGCSLTLDGLRVLEPDPFDVALTLSADRVPLGATVRATLLSTRDLTDVGIRWSPEGWTDCQDCATATLLPSRSDTVLAVLTDPTGCTRTVRAPLEVIPDRAVYVPNAFSPNGDGVNDRLRVFTGPAVRTVELLTLYDRWGGQVFSGRGEDAAWDGTGEDGRALRPGVFVYRATVRFLDGTTREISGEVHLVQ